MSAEPVEEHRRLQGEAVAADGRAQERLLAGDAAGAAAEFAAAAALYRASWEAAPPAAFGRLIGLVKSAVLAGDPSGAAAYAAAQIGDDPPSPPAAYARALAALALGDADGARAFADRMRPGGDAFARAADAIAASDPPALEAALAAIEADFAGRAEHLTGVPIADTALVIRRLRGG